MVKTFELLHKALLILAFWSFILLCVHFVRGNVEGGWVLTFANYITNILMCTVMFIMISIAFFRMHYLDYKKKIEQFYDVEIDGFKCNVGQPFRLVAIPKEVVKCEALDLHTLYFEGGEIYRVNEEKEQAELKKNEDSEKIADLMLEKLNLQTEQKNIQATLVNYIYSKRRVEELEKETSLSKHEENELTELKSNISSIDEDDLKGRVANLKKQISLIEEQIKDVTGVDSRTQKSSQEEDEETINTIVDEIQKSDGGYTMYGEEEVNFGEYKEANRKGLLFYRTQFEQLYSSLSAEKRNEVDRNVANLMEALPNFGYEGISSTTPKIKKHPNFEIDLKAYQLSIFTAFFSVVSWLDLRESGCLPTLALRDKRMLWGAKRLYDIYTNRDADLKKNRPSSYSIPLKAYKNGFRLAHEELGCLVELWRFVENAKLVEITESRSKVSSSITNHDLIELVKNLITEEERINGGNRDKRIGFWYDAKLYLEWEKFMVEARLLFVNYYHNEAQKVKNLDALIFNALKEEGYLAMEIKDKFKPLDKGSVHDNGELFDVTWESTKSGGGDDDKSHVSRGTLVVHLRRAFRRATRNAKKGSNAATKFAVSEDTCVKGTPFWESRQKNIEYAAKGKELVEEQIAKSRAAMDAESKTLEQLAEEEKSKPINLDKVVSKQEKPTNSIDGFIEHLLENSAKVAKDAEKKDSKTKAKDKAATPKQDKAENKVEENEGEFKLESPQVDNSSKANKKKKNKVVEKNAFEAEPIDVLEDSVPKEKQGVVLEVKEENKRTPTYFIKYLNQHLEKIDSRTKSERSFLSRVYLDRLRFQILTKQIEVKENNKPYWQLNKEQILKYIPVEMQLHLLTQPKIENLYEVIPQPVQNKTEFKDQMTEIQKVIASPIKQIRTINIMKISHSPEIEMYKNLELMIVRQNDLSRFIAQLEEKCFTLRKERSKDIEFNPTPSSNTHYGVYRILATNSHILGDLNAPLKNYCAYKHKMGFKHFDDEIGKMLDTIFCVNLEASHKTVFVFFAPKHTGSKYEQYIKQAEAAKLVAQKDMFEEFTQEEITDGTIDFALSISEEEVKKQKNKEPTIETKAESNSLDTPETGIVEPTGLDTPVSDIEEPTDLDTLVTDIEEPSDLGVPNDLDIPELDIDEPSDLDTPELDIEEPKDLPPPENN